MTILNSLKILFFSLISTVIIISPFLLLTKNKLYDIDQIYVSQAWLPEKRKKISIENKDIVQSFIAKENNLAGIDLALPYIGDDSTHTLQIGLYEETLQNKIINIIVMNQQIQGETHPLRVKFEPVNNSKDKIYLFKIENISYPHNEIYLNISAYDTYSEGKLTIDGREQSGDMNFIPVYKAVTNKSYLNIMKTRISKNTFIQGNGILILFTCLILIIFTFSFLFISNINNNSSNSTNT